MKLQPEAITFFISCMFALAGIFNYMAQPVYPALWIMAFISLLATIGIDAISRIEVDYEQ